MPKIDYVTCKNRVKRHLNGKYLGIIFLALLFACGIELLNFKANPNFWLNLYKSFSNNVTNIIFFSVIILNVFIFNKEFKNDYYLYNRYGTYKNRILNDLVGVILMSLILFCVFFILNLAFSILGSANNFAMIDYNYYGINSLLYFIFELLRYGVYTMLVAIFTYLICNIKNKYLYFLAVIVLLFSVFYQVNQIWPISSLTSSPFLFTFYLSQPLFESFSLEVTCSIVNMVFYILLAYVFYTIKLRKKCDV